LLVEAPAQQSSVYLLWAVGTQLFKVGYTHASVDQRAAAIMAMSPIPLRIIAERPGGRADELALHVALRQYRQHGEWFQLPEDAVFWALEQFGIEKEHVLEHASHGCEWLGFRTKVEYRCSECGEVCE
jgi:hypothetical protein